ncbi:ABC transporter permease [Verminephrobacter aporrectodeae subsp. tuberculatae]|nr:ABC transporter permease [Verminephrobacter aporrectodeae subsp. tuberculatae]MCW8197572.1 ABC transporter permease [Verminephrobacter aporrectodeae subsp. tuberculatae]MCW8202226.1 ABC transporter permease [Verminephrobacter aporrectodeae subsp. tuberculatae]
MHEPWSGRLRRTVKTPEGYLSALLAVLVLFFGALAPGFLSSGNAVNLIEGCCVTAIMAIGLLVVLVVGGIDISFAATASVAQYLAGYLATRAHWPMPLVIAANLLTGALLGGLNALLIDRLRATSIIITISTMSLYFALLMYFTGGRSIYDLPAWWSDPVVLWQWSGEGDTTVRVTLPILVLLVVAAFTAWLLNRTALGRQVHAVGGNPEAARRVGVRLLAVHLFAYGYLGLLAALAGLVQAHRVGESVPNALVGGELFVLASAVLGGASLTGGTGTVGGVLLGIVLLAVLRNGLNLMGISPYFFQVLLGLVVLASAAATGRKHRRPRDAIA